jgi:putative heme iron utilization protein
MAAPDAVAPTPYDARGEARMLLRGLRAGSLATLTPEGAPFASLVSVATMPDGRPILLLSTLAAHTRHLSGDARCSLLLSRGGKGDPLAHPRLTLTGTAHRVAADDEALARARFLRRQPKAALYAGFPDFGFFVMDLSGGHLNGGFARAARFAGADLLTSVDDAADLLAAEAEAVEHMNAEHRVALRLYGEVLCGGGAGAWRASGLDPDGLDLVCGDRVTRLTFDERITTAGALRRALKELASRARQSGMDASSGEAGT